MLLPSMMKSVWCSENQLDTLSVMLLKSTLVLLPLLEIDIFFPLSPSACNNAKMNTANFLIFFYNIVRATMHVLCPVWPLSTLAPGDADTLALD